MYSFLGCLFVFLFGGLFLLLAFSRVIISWIYNALMFRLFGIKPPRHDTHAHSQSQSSTSHPNTSAGNAHHEGRTDHASSRQRTGKIFSQDEGTYVDFEEIKS